ncbi:MAG: RNB domain-containing ribonuclease, partial [Candidatus Xenobia bacterium]
MIHDASQAPKPPKAMTPKVGFDVHVLKDVHHADEADLHRIGEAAYKLAGFRAEVTAAERAQIAAANPARVMGEPGVRDMRDRCWSAIDNTSSKDPDQVSYAERLPDGNIRIYVAVADVDDVVGQKSPLDQRALDNMTSVYTDLDTYNMLPVELCNDKTVLVAGRDRPAVVTEMTVTPQGERKDQKIYRAVVNNHAQLSYPQVESWFSDPQAAMPEVKDLPEQLKLQDEAASWLEAAETASGRPAHPHDGNERSQRLVEMQMRAVNRMAADFLLAHGMPALVRARRLTPEAWAQVQKLATERGATLPAEPNAAALQSFVTSQKQIEVARAEAEKAARIAAAERGQPPPEAVERPVGVEQAVSRALGHARTIVAQPGQQQTIFTMGTPPSAR